MSEPGAARTILALIDLTPQAARVEAAALSLARLHGASIHFLHVEPPEPEFVGYGPGPRSVREGLAGEFRGDHASLQAYAERARAAGLQAVALQVRGELVNAVAEHAARLSAEMVVAGFRRHGIVHRIAVGDTISELMERLACPLVLVPGRDAGGA